MARNMTPRSQKSSTKRLDLRFALDDGVDEPAGRRTWDLIPGRETGVLRAPQDCGTPQTRRSRGLPARSDGTALPSQHGSHDGDSRAAADVLRQVEDARSPVGLLSGNRGERRGIDWHEQEGHPDALNDARRRGCAEADLC